MFNETSKLNFMGSTSKYTFFEAFIVVLFIISQLVDSTAINIILGLSIFSYIHTRLAATDKKIDELSNQVSRDIQAIKRNDI